MIALWVCVFGLALIAWVLLAIFRINPKSLDDEAPEVHPVNPSDDGQWLASFDGR